MSKKETISVKGIPIFKPVEFDRFRNEAGSNYFVLSPQRPADTTTTSAKRAVATTQPRRLKVGGEVKDKMEKHYF